MPKLPESNKAIYMSSNDTKEIHLGDEYWTVDTFEYPPKLEKHKVTEITKITREYITENEVLSKTEFRYRLDTGRMFQSPFGENKILGVYKTREEAFEEYENTLNEIITNLTSEYEENFRNLELAKEALHAFKNR